MTIKRFLSFWFFLLFIVILQTTWAAGEVELILEKHVTAIEPVFMTGHLGDPEWVQGFHFEGDIFVKGGDTKIGGFIGDVSLLNPPMNNSEVYDEAFIRDVNIIQGLGSFQVTSLGLALGNSTNDGSIIFSWSGSISNGTASLINLYGLSAGNATANVFMSTGVITEVLNMRFGY